LWSGCAFIKEGNCRFNFNRLDDCLSWSGRAYIRYGNCVLKFSRPDAHRPWSGRVKTYKEITCSGRATVRTMCHPVRTSLLNRKDFPVKFSEKSCRTVVCLDGPCPPSRRRPGIFFPDSHLSPQPINRGPWALRTVRIRY
jgi:hypothetical protein